MHAARGGDARLLERRRLVLGQRRPRDRERRLGGRAAAAGPVPLAQGLRVQPDKPGILDDQADLFKSSLKKVDVTFQNLDSSEISLSDVSHYFDSDPTKVVSGLRTDGKKPTAFVADTTTANAQVRTLSETVRLDSRTKLLNPKFYEGMLKSGYEGTREITKRLRNTMGWSATAGAVDNFVYEDANDIFIADPEMQKRLMETNPNAFRDMVTTFLEANGRGYWDTTEIGRAHV